MADPWKLKNLIPDFNKDEPPELTDLRQRINRLIDSLTQARKPQNILTFLNGLSRDYFECLRELSPILEKLNNILRGFQQAAELMASPLEEVVDEIPQPSSPVENPENVVHPLNFYVECPSELNVENSLNLNDHLDVSVEKPDDEIVEIPPPLISKVVAQEVEVRTEPQIESPRSPSPVSVSNSVQIVDLGSDMEADWDKNYPSPLLKIQDDADSNPHIIRSPSSHRLDPEVTRREPSNSRSQSSRSRSKSSSRRVYFYESPQVHEIPNEVPNPRPLPENGRDTQFDFPRRESRPRFRTEHPPRNINVVSPEHSYASAVKNPSVEFPPLKSTGAIPKAHIPRYSENRRNPPKPIPLMNAPVPSPIKSSPKPVPLMDVKISNPISGSQDPPNLMSISITPPQNVELPDKQYFVPHKSRNIPINFVRRVPEPKTLPPPPQKETVSNPPGICCWNCKEPHYLTDCPYHVDLLCFKCGKKGFTSRNCPVCSQQPRRKPPSSRRDSYDNYY